MKTILTQIQLENASEQDLQEDLQELLACARKRGIPTPTHDEDKSGVESDDIEALANDFVDAGYEVDFDDGPCITIYEHPDRQVNS